MYATGIHKEKAFLYINGINVLQLKVSEIITDFLKEGNENYIELGNNLSLYKNVQSNLFPEIYCSTKRRGFDLKSTFYIIFKTYKDKKNECLGKNLQNYENVCDEKSVYEQKPLKIDDFNEAEEKEVKEHDKNLQRQKK